MNSICKLCLQKKELKRSHLVPKFIWDWIKKTSVTGYLRQAINANLRMQDGQKEYLFCGDCEQLIGEYESEFAKNVFYPYVNTELNDWGSAQGIIKLIEYREWLLKFIISLQFRHLLTQEPAVKDKIGESKYKLLKVTEEIFREYLMFQREDTGVNRSYIIFLQNLSFGQGYFPQELNEKINFYLLRAVDGTIASSSTKLGLYIKIGPIAVFTSIIPYQVKGMNSLIVKKKGNLSTVQQLRNSALNRFIFIDRPNDTMKLINISPKQQDVIENSYKNHEDQLLESMTIKSAFSDKYLMEELKGKKTGG